MSIEVIKQKNKRMYAIIAEKIDKHHFGDKEIRKNNFRRMALAIRNKLNLSDSRGYHDVDDQIHLMRFYLQNYMIMRLVFDPLDKVIDEIEEMDFDEMQSLLN